ncbi:MAG: BrnT family toxin [Sedimenticola sp.]
MKFEWDQTKAVTNEKKHSISFSEATTVLGDPLELTISDPGHSVDEYRFLSIGRSSTGNLLVVSYTERQLNQISIISARKATRQEKPHYEQNY